MEVGLVLDDPVLLLRSLLQDEDTHSTFNLFVEFKRAPGSIKPAAKQRQLDPLRLAYDLSAKLLGLYYCLFKALWFNHLGEYISQCQTASRNSHNERALETSQLALWLSSRCLLFRIQVSFYLQISLSSIIGFQLWFLSGTAHKHCNWVML